MAELPLTPFPFDGDDVVAVVSTRHGGVSEGPYASLNLADHVGDDPTRVLHNRRLLAERLGVEAITVADQQHRATCAVVTPETAGRGFSGVEESRRWFPATDALVSAVPGVALGVVVADCAPVLLWDPVRRAVGAAHAGRPGVVAGVVASTVQRMHEEFATEAADLVVGIGPCVGYDSYPVGRREVDDLEAVLPDRGLTKARGGEWLLDVGGGVEQQLADLGVRRDHVHRMPVDTRTATDTYFSDRATRPCGRFMAVVVLRS
ncbi:MAG: polyphenol oxidase family protein [Nocardioides sp.]